MTMQLVRVFARWHPRPAATRPRSGSMPMPCPPRTCRPAPARAGTSRCSCSRPTMPPGTACACATSCRATRWRCAAMPRSARCGCCTSAAAGAASRSRCRRSATRCTAASSTARSRSASPAPPSPRSTRRWCEIAQCLGIDLEQIVAPVLNAATSRVKTLVRLESPNCCTACVTSRASRRCATGSARPGSIPSHRTPMRRGAEVSARQFPRSSGYPEDAATGIAAAALAWGLREMALVGADGTLVTVRQGEAMGSPSAIQVRLPAQAARRAAGCAATRRRWTRNCRMTDADRRLEALAPRPAATPRPPRARGRYASFARAGDLLHSSGVVGRENGVVIAGTIEPSTSDARASRSANGPRSPPPSRCCAPAHRARRPRPSAEDRRPHRLPAGRARLHAARAGDECRERAAAPGVPRPAAARAHHGRRGLAAGRRLIEISLVLQERAAT